MVARPIFIQWPFVGVPVAILGQKSLNSAIEVLSGVNFERFFSEYLVSFCSGYTFATLLRLTICQIA